ncbi:kinase-like domain-containing protein [Suillus subaureus]|uniref:Kinase-like domain-containing protein n=1 Tax=Suillus subaureus TaxID=48587 RepID=A0A9P7JBA7_9AGAM|nr:kinase-like domain-containing protein [Suillus subaureus]KAG1812470.1 kinase-like domain-containing protein [Suillus subaureus]
MSALHLNLNTGLLHFLELELASCKYALPMMGPAPEDDVPSDFTPQISEKLKLARPCASGSFGDVYRFTIEINKGTTEVAVKVVKIHPPKRSIEKIEKAMRRELKVWLRLSKYPTIVPLLGVAHVGSHLPGLISQWMPSGTLYMYLEQGTVTASAKAQLVTGIAEGLRHLHSENVIHGDLHPANVLIDGVGNPLLTDFGLATVVGDPDLQWGSTTAGSDFNPRWRAPEVIGIKGDPELPTFESDIYSFGGVMIFVVSGDVPWKHKGAFQIVAALAERANPVSARPHNILDNHWVLIQKCWSWDPLDRPRAVEVLGCIHQFSFIH